MHPSRKTRNIARLARSTARRDSRRARSAGRGIGCERLEERTVLSTFLVASPGDGGAGTLRQAILDANATPGADSIRFAIPTAVSEQAVFTGVGGVTGGGWVNYITRGPDGNTWYTEEGFWPDTTNGKIGRITPDGSVTEFSLPTHAAALGITAGPDGNVWFTERNFYGANRVGRITPDGAISEFVLLGTRGADRGDSIVAGTDGNLWIGVTESDPTLGAVQAIRRMTPDGVVTGEIRLPGGLSTSGLAVGPDGNFWMHYSEGLVRVTPAGDVTCLAIPNAVEERVAELAAGPDGNLWYTKDIGGKIGRVNRDLSVTEFPVPTPFSRPSVITAGADGNLWFTEYTSGKIGRITTAGAITEFSDPKGPFPYIWSIASSSDGSLYYADWGRGQIDRLELTPSATYGRVVIRPTSPLPAITESVSIDGTSQPGYAGSPLIVLDGRLAGPGDGLTIGADDCTVAGLAIGNFAGDGVHLLGSRTTVQGNYIGLDATGESAMPNTGFGIEGRAGGNTIGGLTATPGTGPGNVISANNLGGVLAGPNLLLCNIIGLDAAGEARTDLAGRPLGNAGGGVLTRAGFATIGGTAPGARNIISGNGLAGIGIDGPGDSFPDRLTLVQGNYIGTDLTGTRALGNLDGISGFGAPILVGGTDPGARNVVSGNDRRGMSLGGVGPGSVKIQGNYVGLDATGSTRLPNAEAGIMVTTGEGVLVGGDLAFGADGRIAGAGNVVSGNDGDGISLQGGTRDLIAGNLVGTDATGTRSSSAGPDGVDGTDDDVPLGNRAGIYLTGGDGVVIGGTTPSARNVIAGNYYGIFGGARSTDVIEGNTIGLDASGARPLGNRLGIYLIMGSGITVGGTAAGAANVISGNNDAVYLSGLHYVDAGLPNPGFAVVGNLIGTDPQGGVPRDATGRPLLANHIGVIIDGSPNNAVLGNTIRGNLEGGVAIANHDSSGNLVRGNLISETVAGPGLVIRGAPRNLAESNRIERNAEGVWITNYAITAVDGGSVGNVIRANAIVDNVGHGVAVWTYDNTIGGAAAGDGNTIAGNGVGVRVAVSGNEVPGNGDAILSNAISGNSGIGIDLGSDGVTPNDANGHQGPNLYQDFPTLSLAYRDGVGTTVVGTLVGTPGGTYTIQVFSNDVADPSGHGQGQVYLGSVPMTIVAGATPGFSFTYPGRLPAGTSISATATDPDGNTSEFAADVPVLDAVPIAGLAMPPSGVAGQVLGFTLTAADLSPVARAAGFLYTIDWGDGTAAAPDVQVVPWAPGNGAGAFLAHAFAADGSYTLRLTATDIDGTSGPTLVGSFDVRAMSTAALQAAISPQSPGGAGGRVAILAAGRPQADAVIAAVNGLASPTAPATIALELGPGTYGGETIRPPAGVTLILDASGGRVVFVGHSPALTVASGQVSILGGQFTNATDAPAILVTGGSLTMRQSTIEESTGYAQVALLVTGGAVDLGTAAEPGGNVIDVNGAGAWARVTGPTPVSAVGDSFTVDGVAPPPSAVSGLVFSDFNEDGQVDFGERGIAGVTVALNGVDDLGAPVHLSRATDADGTYVFRGLRPGHYAVTESQPAGYTQGINSVGTGGGTVSADVFDVLLAAGLNALNYNYAERPAATGAVAKGQTAGIGFWNNKNGQALIKGLNGGAGTQLGDWLGATFPHVFGRFAGAGNLIGRGNAAIAATFQADFVAKDDKLDAQMLAAALSVYVTDATLDNTKLGAQYGFLVAGDGVGTATSNVGTNGVAFGVADGTVMTVMDLLLAADAQAVKGVLYSGNAASRKKAGAVFGAINGSGGI